MLGRTRLAVATLVALTTFAGCGDGTMSTDDWLEDQFPDDVHDMTELSILALRSGDPESCAELSDWVADARGGPHPEDPLLADGWDGILDTMDELAEVCPSRDPSQITPLLQQYGDRVLALRSRIATG